MNILVNQILSKNSPDTSDAKYISFAAIDLNQFGPTIHHTLFALM